VQLEGKRFLLIGGAGFIGSWIAEELLKRDVAEVLIYDNFCRGRLENLSAALRDPRCKIFPLGGDILHADLLERAMQGMDGVFHAAALWLLHCQEYPDSAFEVNVRGTYNVIRAVLRAGVSRLVFSSSASVYGNAVEIPMTEEHPYNNNTFYGATKIAGEHLLKALGHQHDLAWIGLRYMNVYGPRQDYQGAYTAVMHKVLDRIEIGERPQVHGDGSQEYDFIHVRDVARCNVLAMACEARGGFYNVGRGVGTTIRELTDLLLNLTGSGLEAEYLPAEQSFVTKRIGCTKRAEQELGFRWQIDLREGMRELIDWRRQDAARLRSAAGAAQTKLGA